MAVMAAAPVRVQVAPDTRCAAQLASALEKSGTVAVVTQAPEVVLRLFEGSLELSRPDGSRLLGRKLEHARECRELAFATVLIVERYVKGIELRSLPAPPDAGLPRPKPRPPAPLVDAGSVGEEEPVREEPIDAGPAPEEPPDAGPPLPPLEPPRVAVTPAPAPPPPPPAPPLLTGAEAIVTGGVDFSASVHGLFALEAALLFHRVRVGLLGQGATPESSPVLVDRGRLETQSFGALASAGPCFEPLHRLRLCASAQLGARFVRGTTSGDFVFQSTTVVLVRPAAALEAQLAWRLWRGLLLTLSLAAATVPIPAEFTVEGDPAATRRSPIFEGQLRAGAGFGVSR